MGLVLELGSGFEKLEMNDRLAKDDDLSSRLLLVHFMSGWDIHGFKRNDPHPQRIMILHVAEA
jgi:hypothetical protein